MKDVIWMLKCDVTAALIAFQFGIVGLYIWYCAHSIVKDWNEFFGDHR